MNVVFCAEPFETNLVDDVYEKEAAAARACGLTAHLIDFEALVRDDGNARRATRFIKPFEQEESAIYRGWMLKPAVYEKLYRNLLVEKNLRLINAPAAYKICHHLPKNYPYIEQHTPRTIFVPVDEDFQIEKVFDAIAVFGDKPLVLKDYVKSRKHEWAEACFIENASDREKVERVVGRFLELQGEDLNEGLAFREFIEFAPLTVHSKSKMPLTREFRLFYLDGKEIYSSRYWEEGDYGREIDVPRELFANIAQNVPSRFFTMDVAEKTDGEFLVVELGDAQVSGLPESADETEFYEALKQNFL